MSHQSSFHLDVLTLGQQTVLPAQLCASGVSAVTGGIGLLAGPVFFGTPTSVQFAPAAPTSVINIVPSLSVPGGSALTISSDGLSAVPYPGIGINAHALTHNFLAETSINLVSPVTSFTTNQILLGTYEQVGASAMFGVKSDTGARTEAGSAVEFDTLWVTGNIQSPTIDLIFQQLSTKKTFDITHPTKDDWRLRYVCLEGPSADVFVRGRLKDKNVIELPEYWSELVDVETISVNLTPIGVYQELFVDRIEWGTKIFIKNNLGGPIDCNYFVAGERKDTEKNISEYPGKTYKDYPGNNTEYTINR